MKMDINLDVLSLRELKDLQGRVARAIASYEDRKKKEALAELEIKAREMGYSLAELLALQGVGKPPRKRALAVPKYANPANAADTWTGRGRKPRWFIEALANGRAPEDLAI
jgi:DNA-binding protein H-NS